VQYVEFAKSRFDAAIAEIQRLKHYEFPYPHIQDALDSLERLFCDRRVKLDTIVPALKPEVAKNACQQSLQFLFRFTPYLGFVVRSTNVRNAFELYPPLMRLARSALGATTKLLMSSEWDYSPFVYLPQKELADFVLIGVPAYESANALLTPLSGHELGHSIWKKQQLAAKFMPRIEQAVLDAIRNNFWQDFEAYCQAATPLNLTNDIFVRQAWLPILEFAVRQLEEIFCDTMGLRLFAEAYLNAFAYLLAPGLPSEQSLNYPEISQRVNYLLQAASQLGVVAPVDYSHLFQSQPAPAHPVFKLFTEIAANATSGLIVDVVNEVESFSNTNVLPQRSLLEVSRIAHDFKRIMPCEGRAALTDIVNAGWQTYLDTEVWSNIPQLKRVDRVRVLNDLVLKSCEVSEFENRLNSP